MKTKRAFYELTRMEKKDTRVKKKLKIPHYENKDLADLPGEYWVDIPGLEGYGMISNLARIKRLSYEIGTKDGKTLLMDERIQAQKQTRHFNQFVQDYKQHLCSRIQIGGVTHSLSVGRIMYYCFVENFDLEDHTLYVTYEDGNGLNPLPENLALVDLSGLQQRIIKANRKDLHFGHSEENQRLFVQMGILSNIKKVSQYSMEGKYIATYESLSSAAKAMDTSISAISSVARKRALTAAGYIWRFGNSKMDIAVKKINRAIRDTKGVPVTRYDLDGNKIKTYYNINQAAIELGVERKAISDAVNGKVIVTSSSVWRRGEEEKIDVTTIKESLSLRKGYTMSKYDLNGKKVQTFARAIDAAISISVQTEQITAMAIRSDLILKGYIWRYGDAPNLTREEVQLINENLAKPRTKDITQYDLNGRKLGYFPNMKTASLETGVTMSAMVNCTRGYKATGAGYIWRNGNGDDKITIPYTPRPLGNKIVSEVLQYDLNGNYIQTFKSISEAAREVGLHKTTIANAIRITKSPAGGFIWKKAKK